MITVKFGNDATTPGEELYRVFLKTLRVFGQPHNSKDLETYLGLIVVRKHYELIRSTIPGTLCIRDLLLKQTLAYLSAICVTQPKDIVDCRGYHGDVSRANSTDNVWFSSTAT